MSPYSIYLSIYLSIYPSIHPSIHPSPWSRILLEKLLVTQLVKKFHQLIEPKSFLPCSQGVRHWSLSWARCFQSTPSHPTSVRSILILSSRLRFPSGLSPSDSPTKILHACLIYSMRATRPSLYTNDGFCVENTMIKCNYKAEVNGMYHYCQHQVLKI
jgi:hypothetical protein